MLKVDVEGQSKHLDFLITFQIPRKDKVTFLVVRLVLLIDELYHLGTSSLKDLSNGSFVQFYV